MFDWTVASCERSAGVCLVGPPILSLSRFISPPKNAAAAPEKMNTRNIPAEDPELYCSAAFTEPLIDVFGWAYSPYCLRDFRSTDIFCICSILSFSASSFLCFSFSASSFILSSLYCSSFSLDGGLVFIYSANFYLLMASYFAASS